MQIAPPKVSSPNGKASIAVIAMLIRRAKATSLHRSKQLLVGTGGSCKGTAGNIG